MASDEHLNILQKGVAAWNKWRLKNPHIQPDLSGAFWTFEDFGLAGIDFSKTNLREAFFTRTSLVESNLSDADLTDAVLIDTLIYNANLKSANLTNANLSGANLSNSDLQNVAANNAQFIHCIMTKTNLQGADCRGAEFRYARLLDANLEKTILQDANLTGASLINVNVSETDCSGARVYGISAWNLTGKPKSQSDLIITPENEPTVVVDDLQVAQFIYLLLNHQNLRSVLNSVTERGVLLLGRFGGGGIDVLRAVADKLREMKYLPIIFDFERPQDRNYTETIKTLAGLSRFVIVDLSGPSVPQELYATVPHFKIPFVPIIEKGKRPYAMFADILEYDWVVKPIIEFDTTTKLIKSLPSKVVAPAEKRHKKREKLLRELFPE